VVQREPVVQRKPVVQREPVAAAVAIRELVAAAVAIRELVAAAVAIREPVAIQTLVLPRAISEEPRQVEATARAEALRAAFTDSSTGSSSDLESI
jgi:hypothetical protein